MGTRTDHGFLFVVCSDHGYGSLYCESRVRPPLGRRAMSLDPPCLGGRNHGRHCCQDWNKAHDAGANGRCYACTHSHFFLQDMARRLASSGQYKVSDGYKVNHGVTRKPHSDGSVGVYTWMADTVWL
ncbi:hypothetical protein V6N13_057057 [Hibiscus sabdariffa]|uniref:Uncharacterized protein n=1 Tax=Hibiscus sabdariffa TaxID=183260 RepID=A0ABR2D2R8_9ROSI